MRGGLNNQSLGKCILQTRTRVPNEVIQQIKSLNNLDVELYKYAKVIFVKEHELVSKKLVSTVSPSSWSKDEMFFLSFWYYNLSLQSKRSIVDLQNELRSVFGGMDDEKMWKFVSVALMLLLLFLLFLFVNARRRRTSKVKIWSFSLSFGPIRQFGGALSPICNILFFSFRLFVEKKKSFGCCLTGEKGKVTSKSISFL